MLFNSQLLSIVLFSSLTFAKLTFKPSEFANQIGNDKDIKSNDLFKIDFKVRRGQSKQDLSPEDDDSPRLFKRDGSFDMVLSNQQTFYMATLEIGTNKDKNNVLVDTGSSDLWVMSHDLQCIANQNTRRSLNDHLTDEDLTTDGEKDSNSSEIETESQINLFNQGTGVLNSKVYYEKKQQHQEQQFKRQDKDDENPTPTKSENPQNKLIGYTTVYYTDGPGSNPSFSPFGGSGGSNSGSNSCTSHGSFNTGNSDSFTRNNTDSFQILYADGTEAMGIWGYDDVSISNITVNDLSFAIANVTSSDIGVLGVGLPGLEVTTQYGYMYENLPIKLRNQGIINKAAFSVYLNEADAKQGSMLFGAVDHAKYVGTLETLPMLRTYSTISYPVRIEVEVSKISTVSSSGDETNILSDSTGAVLDTGSTLSYVFSDTLTAIGQAVGGRYSSSVGAYIVDCNLQQSSGRVDIQFGNKTIQVPISDLTLQVSSSQCILGLLEQSSSSSYMLFGDNVLRSAYVVFDLDDYEVHLAQVYYTDDEDIEIISNNVPLAGGQNGTLSTSGGSSSSTSSSSSRENDSNKFAVSIKLLVSGLLICYYLI